MNIGHRWPKYQPISGHRLAMFTGKRFCDPIILAKSRTRRCFTLGGLFGDRHFFLDSKIPTTGSLESRRNKPCTPNHHAGCSVKNISYFGICGISPQQAVATPSGFTPPYSSPPHPPALCLPQLLDTVIRSTCARVRILRWPAMYTWFLLPPSFSASLHCTYHNN